jgi:hypothetical protein
MINKKKKKTLELPFSVRMSACCQECSWKFRTKHMPFIFKRMRESFRFTLLYLFAVSHSQLSLTFAAASRQSYLPAGGMVPSAKPTTNYERYFFA